MALAGRALEGLGIILLMFAGYFLLAALSPPEAWDFLKPTYLPASGFLGFAGGCALLGGINFVRRERNSRESKQVLKYRNSSLRGVVCGNTGSPVRGATVEVFIESAQEKQQMAALRTDAMGRFSADLPEGPYVLEVGVPESGEFIFQAAIPNSGQNPELQITLDAAHEAR